MADIIDEAMAAIALTEGAEVAAIRSKLSRPGCSICENCGELIPAARRKLLPSVTTCVTCQEIVEFRERTGQKL
ncbi:TraR/DksA C4-type zinc finger protein [Candidatus Pantoea deserta]|nr:TraR/DksA C4-type zinc finger protein [Pantoea deserta]